MVGRFLHSSHWPTILSSDSAATSGVPARVVTITTLKTFFTVLVGVAAIVTPLGLHQEILSSRKATPSAFHYVADKSQFGYGTPPRTGLPWSRICGSWEPVNCPNSPQTITYVHNSTGDYWVADYYDSHVPQYVINVFESGLSTMAKTISSIFDIQTRSYTRAQINDSPNSLAADNGSAYPVTAYRQIASLVLEDDFIAIEGLVVDMKTGGIGFRNHSAPPVSPFGSEWSEDLLFVEPETVCVDTNLTLDFTVSCSSPTGTLCYAAQAISWDFCPFSPLTFVQIPRYGSFAPQVSELVLTDRGGFANLIKKYPTWQPGDTQKDPELYLRAYKAAWINNAWSMAFMNVTNLANQSDPNSHAFEYLDSYVGKTFPLMSPNGTGLSGMSGSLGPDFLSTSSMYGYYLNDLDQGTGIYNNGTSLYNFSSSFNESTSVPPLYTNPFGIDSTNFSSAGKFLSLTFSSHQVVLLLL